MMVPLCLSVLFFAVLVLSVTGTTSGQDPAIAANYNISESSSAKCGDGDDGGGQEGNWPEGQSTMCQSLGGTCVIPGKERCTTKFYEGDDMECKARYDNKHLCCMHEDIADAPCTSPIGGYRCLDVNVCDDNGGTVLKATHLCGGPRCRKCCRDDPFPGHNVSTSRQTTKSAATVTPHLTTTTPQLATTTPQLATTKPKLTTTTPQLTTTMPQLATTKPQLTTTTPKPTTTTPQPTTTTPQLTTTTPQPTTTTPQPTTTTPQPTTTTPQPPTTTPQLTTTTPQPTTTTPTTTTPQPTTTTPQPTTTTPQPTTTTPQPMTPQPTTTTPQPTTTTPQPTTTTPQLTKTTSESARGTPQLTTRTSQRPTTTDNRQTTIPTTQPADHLTTTFGTNETCEEMYKDKPIGPVPSPFPPQILCHALGGHCVDMTKARCGTKYFDGSLQCKEAFGANFGCCMKMETADGQCTGLGLKFTCMDAKECEPSKGEVIPAGGLCGGPSCRMCCHLK